MYTRYKQTLMDLDERLTVMLKVVFLRQVKLSYGTLLHFTPSGTDGK